MKWEVWKDWFKDQIGNYNEGRVFGFGNDYPCYAIVSKLPEGFGELPYLAPGGTTWISNGEHRMLLAGKNFNPDYEYFTIWREKE